MSEERKWGAEELRGALQAHFPEGEVKFKPGPVKGDKALALAYVDARCVQDRLDDVFGVAGWQDEYTLLPDGACLCRLRVKVNGEWIEKMDVGSESEQKDEHDRHKAAVSDALKRAAVKLGIGRYLYRIGVQWAGYDAQKRAITGKPRTTPQGQARPGREAAPSVDSNRARVLALAEAARVPLARILKAHAVDSLEAMGEDVVREAIGRLEGMLAQKQPA